MVKLTSRDRMLRAIRLQDIDHIPCCFMSNAILRKRLHENWFEVAKAEYNMGLDPMLFIPTAPRSSRRDHPDLRGLPIRFSPEVKVKEWRSHNPDGYESLCKEYETPAGKLTTEIRLTEDWPYGDHIPFVDDYQVPRARKPLIEGPDDLAALDYMFLPPAEQDIHQYKQEAQVARAFAQEMGILLAGGWGVGMDLANWLCGVQNLMFLVMENPELVIAILEKIHIWNMHRMEVVLSAPVDLYIRRAWYEGCDFITPLFFKRAILPRLKVEADLAHEYGTLFGYICSSGTKPMLEFYKEAGIDVLIGVDPVQGTHTDMPLMKAKLGDRTCLWGGVSAAVTVERGTESDVRAAVRQACQVLGPQGFILSPVDNLTVDEPLTDKNIQIFIDEWMRQH